MVAQAGFESKPLECPLSLRRAPASASARPEVAPRPPFIPETRSAATPRSAMRPADARSPAVASLYPRPLQCGMCRCDAGLAARRRMGDRLTVGQRTLDSASLGSNPSPPASPSECFRWSERAGEAQQKTSRFPGLCGTAGLAAPVERRQAGERASDAAEFLCRALMHWRNSVDAHRPRSRVPADQAASPRTGPTGVPPLGYTVRDRKSPRLGGRTVRGERLG